ncbi:MAG: 2-amino-4-hydroxy-6-hydroxymethyldihydropteridine diphosphokinase [Proteobacteria bacterium]|nr:MAG: 2-amino-4-hydroxy-6-hydroxymethyldihydropteridine diphosphokinase [Pseudomonadota bacterium]
MSKSKSRCAGVYVGLGSNLDNPIGQLRTAKSALSMLPRTRLERCSSFYRTVPVGYAEQSDFLNAVCRLSTELDPAMLVEHLLAIEVQHGRVERKQKWGPRILDLDLLLYDQSVMSTPGVTVPHPRLHERAFVLYPLSELDGNLIVPGRGKVTELLVSCREQKIEKIDTTCLGSS